MLYYSYPQIVLQDVPDEISLALSISGCSLKCKGCHSFFTWDPIYGDELTDSVFLNLLNKNKHISCVLFYGGEWNKKRLIELFLLAKSFKLKICLYTGLNLNELDKDFLIYLDYLKVGRYVKELGNLRDTTTNQRFYKIVENKLIDNTKLFQ